MVALMHALTKRQWLNTLHQAGDEILYGDDARAFLPPQFESLLEEWNYSYGRDFGLAKVVIRTDGRVDIGLTAVAGYSHDVFPYQAMLFGFERTETGFSFESIDELYRVDFEAKGHWFKRETAVPVTAVFESCVKICQPTTSLYWDRKAKVPAH